MPMLIRYVDEIFDTSDRQVHLFVGFNSPWTQMVTDDNPQTMPGDTAERLHEEWFAKHGIKTEVVGPPLGSGYICGGHMTWVDLEEDDPLIEEYSRLFETDGVTNHPTAYKAFFYDKKFWEEQHKEEYYKMKADPKKYWDEFNP